MSNKFKINSIVNLIGKKFFVSKKNVALHEPSFNQNELLIMNQCIKSKSVSTAGNYTKKFENEIAKVTKAKFVTATINGTAALHLALIALGVKKDEEVLVPAINYIASANACLYLGANPHFVDVNYETLGIDVKKLEKYLKKITSIRNGICINKKTKKKISAIIPMHTFGHPVEIDKIKILAKKFKLFLIEDAAEALGSFFKKKHVGTFGDIGILSFNGNKIITTGGGGALLTNNKNIAKRISHLSSISKVNHKWKYEYNEIGYNYKMPSLNASLGLGQMKKISEFVKKKRSIFKLYQKTFKENIYFKLFREPKNCKSNYWLQAIILNKNNKNIRNDIVNLANKKGIKIRAVWRPIHKSKYLKKYPKMNLENTIDLENRILNLPSSPDIINLLK